MKRLILVAMAVCCSACAASAPQPEIVSSKVTVTSSGKVVNDFDSEFVHRAVLSSAELTNLSRFSQVQDSFDQFGKGVGLQLTGDMPALYLQRGDILTAIGRKVLKPGDRLSLLKSEVKDQETSITFLRIGRAYKTLIKVQQVYQ